MITLWIPTTQWWPLLPCTTPLPHPGCQLTGPDCISSWCLPAPQACFVLIENGTFAPPLHHRHPHSVIVHWEPMQWEHYRSAEEHTEVRRGEGPSSERRGGEMGNSEEVEKEGCSRGSAKSWECPWKASLKGESWQGSHKQLQQDSVNLFLSNSDRLSFGLCKIIQWNTLMSLNYL